MTAPTALFLIITAFLTALLSGIFGMAGGLVLMGALAFVLPVSAAFVTHGLLQLVANGWRAVLHRRYIAWPIFWNYVLASTIAAIVVMSIAFAPSKPLLFLLLGLVPLLVWLPNGWLKLDASKKSHALASGFVVTALNLTAGVAGPLLDIFFVRTELTRHQIVATKSATQVFSHFAKVVVYGAPMLVAGNSVAESNDMPPWWLFVVVIPMSMLGTSAGGWVLDRLSDANFKRWTAWIVTAIGGFYLWKAWDLWL